MKFEFDERISYPVNQVYEIMRDRMDEVVPLVPNVESLTVKQREQRDDGRLYVVNEWQGAPTAVPRALRPFITKELTRWTDHALWDDDRTLVEWRFETASFEKLYDCQGINYFEDAGDGTTVVRLTGELVTHPDELPGAPKRLARMLAPKVEQWLMKMVSPNLSEMPRAVQDFLDRKNA